MNNFPAVFRTLLIYAACVVLAVWLGFVLAGPLTYSSLLVYGLVGFILCFPILLRWHYPLMLVCWHMAAVIIFMPGRPELCLMMILLSLGISVLQRMMSQRSQFIHVPQIILPLFAMLAVIVITARLTGFGLRVFGSSVYGAHKYFYLVAGILGYFALSARRIPLERKNLYLGLFFLGGVVAVIGDLIPLLPHSLYYIYMFFQPNYSFFTAGAPGVETARLSGTRTMSLVVVMYMLARYGIRGIFLSRRPLRWVVFLFFFILGMVGGFRGYIISLGLVFALQFFLEGLHRTKLMAVFLTAGILGALALIPLADHLPYPFQRAISFLPYKVSTAAKMDALASWDWRVQMWQALLPEIPKYLLLGKGYVISPLDYNFVMGPEASVHHTFAQNQALALAEDFHNGPISIAIPFGLWGCLAFLWFLGAGTWAVYRNYRYGDPTLRTVNTFLLAAFAGHAIYFLFAYGGIETDMLTFCGLLGLSVAFNGGVCRRAVAAKPVPATQPARRFARLPSPVPAFQRQRQ